MKNFSVISLIAANFIPFFGVLFLDWSLFSVMFFYWSENVVIGFFNVLKMLKAEKTDPIEQGIKTTSFGKVSYSSKKSSFISFFLFHYGFFMVGHGIFVFKFFGPPDISLISLIAGLASLFISHGISYFENFIGKKEYKRVSPGNLFGQPYSRLLVMHAVVIFGGAAITVFHLPAIAILLLAVLKIVIDLYSHKREHKKFSAEEGTYKAQIFKGGKIIRQSSGDLPPLDVPKSIKDSVIREAFRKTPWLSMITKNFFKELKENPHITNDEMPQKIMSEVMEEFQQRINSELEEEKNKKKESFSENNDTKVRINGEEDDIKNQ